MNFKIIDDGQEITCKILLTFRDDNNDKNYIIYTDGTKDEDGQLEIYSSRYTLENGNYILDAIETEYEWNLIDNMLESKCKEFDKYEED